MFIFSGSYRRSLLLCLTLTWRLYSSLECIETIVNWNIHKDSIVVSCQRCFVMLCSFMSLDSVGKTLSQTWGLQDRILFYGRAFWRPYAKHKEDQESVRGLAWLTLISSYYILFPAARCGCMLHKTSEARMHDCHDIQNKTAWIPSPFPARASKSLRGYGLHTELNIMPMCVPGIEVEPDEIRLSMIKL